MNIAIIFTTTHGTTEKVANYIATKLKKEKVTLIPLKKVGKPDLENFDKIILGASVHMCVIQSVMKKFCKDNLETLLKKDVGLYVCGMEPDLNRQEAELELAYPDELFTQARAKAFVGGEFLFEKMNIFQQIIIKKISKITKTKSDIKYDIVDHFISLMQK